MSRSFIGFVVFCGLLVAISALGVWYMGPTLAGIAVSSDTRENPYYLLHLTTDSEGADQATASAYRSEFFSLAASDGAELRWRAGPLEVAEGSPLLAFDQIELLRFPTGGDLVQMLTGGGYRRLAATLGGLRTLLLGTSEGPDTVPVEGAVMLAMLRMKPDAVAADLGGPDTGGWLGMVDENRGRILWNAPLATIRGSESWNRVVAIHFPDPLMAQAWLSDPATATERAIAERVIEDSLVLLAAGSAVQPR